MAANVKDEKMKKHKPFDFYIYRPETCKRYVKYVVLGGRMFLTNYRLSEITEVSQTLSNRIKLDECRFVGQCRESNIKLQLWERPDGRMFVIEHVEGFTLLYTSVYKEGDYNFVQQVKMDKYPQ